MSLRRELGVSFAVQGAGAVSVLLATLWLGAAAGPEVQGGFSRVKAEIEFVAAFAMFGLPQALFYFVRSGRLGLGRALRWSAGSALVALPIGALHAGALHADAAGAAAPLALALGVAASVAHGQLRALALLGARTAWFNLLTALPQGLVLAGVGAVIVAGQASLQAGSAWAMVFALGYGAAALLAWRYLAGERSRRAAVGQAGAAAPESVAPHAAAPLAAVGWRELGRYGLAAWLTAALATAAILAMQRWVEGTQGAAALGRFTLALTLAQVPLVPVGYAAPLLLRRWMTDAPTTAPARRWAATLAVGVLALAAAVWLAALRWPDLGLGAAYAGTTRALALLLVGAAAEAASRVLAAQAGARGRPWLAARAEAARWAVLGLAWWLPLPPGLLPLCAVWAAAAGAALVLMLASGAAAHPSAGPRAP